MAATRTKMLNEVRRILALTSNQNSFVDSVPRTRKVFVLAASIVLVGIIFSYLITGLIAAAMLLIIVRDHMPSETWNERLFSLLINYKPIDADAYQALLAKIRSEVATRNEVVEWLSVEYGNIPR